MGSERKVACALFAGVIVGVALGLLFAPKSGEETRKMLREKAEILEQKHLEWHRRMHMGHEAKTQCA